MDTGIVVAFPESAALRETLAVLLEHDCELRFLRPEAAGAADCVAASVALVATRRADSVIDDLRQQWPALPIVAVDVTGDATGCAPWVAADSRLHHVPLEPHAIRSAVLQRLAPERDAALRSAARVIGETLRAEVSYAFAALRSFSTLHASSPGPDTYALLATAVREQAHVLGETLDHLDRFRTRPRAVDLSPRFATALCRQLSDLHHAGSGRSVLCEYSVDAPYPYAGPIELTATVVSFLRTHLQRRAAAPVAGVRLTRDGIVIRYRRRRTLSASRSWPLLLAALALQPWSWSISTQMDHDHEVVSLRHAA